MARKPILLLVSALLSLSAFTQQTWRAGEVLVLLSQEARIADVQNELSRVLPDGITVKEMKQLGSMSRYHKLVLEGAGMEERAIANLVASAHGIRGVSLNYLVQYRAVPNDTEYISQWAMDDINVEPVWDITTGGAMANGERIAVAISDEAIETAHPDLQGNIWPGSPHQGSGAFHGTAVASVVGAVGNNAQGIAGVNWDVDIISSAAALDLAEVIEVFEDALFFREQFNNSGGTSGALVVSVTASWGAPGIAECDGFSDPLFHDMATAGIMVITSGPNDPLDLDVAPEYPSSCALAEHLVVSTIGPGGQTPYAFGDNSVHLFAPGLAIIVADELNNYQFADGNSFAIPHVAGAIALLYSVPCPGFADLVMNDPQAARDMVKNAILNNTAPVPGGNALSITGGKLDVFAAYQALMAQCPACDTLTISLITSAGTSAQYDLLNGIGGTIAQGTGDAIAFCAQEGCFTATVVDGAAQPLDGTFAVSFQGTVIHTGSIVNGALDYTFGTVVQGCTDPAAGNYDPNANCDNGTCCSANTVTLYLIAQDEVANGIAQLSVAAGGNTLFNGPVAITHVPEAQLSYGQVTVCAPSGCLAVFAQPGDVALQQTGFAEIPGGPFTEYFFEVGQATTIPVGTQATEVCDGVDNDCDGLVDDGFVWYTDADGDGFGDPTTEQVLCSPPNGAFVQQGGDCDDTNADINPGMLDPCSNADGLDNDCNGAVDDVDLQAWYPDADNDGFGAELPEVIACEQPVGHVTNNADCDDNNNTAFPGAAEICDGLDNDCDGTADEEFLWYADMDGDGFGDDTTAQPSCSPVPGAVQVGGDCDDTNAALQGGVTLFVVSEFGISAGSAHYVITQGTTTHEGDLILADSGEDYAEGSVSVCLGTGCFSIAVTPNDVPLSELAFVQIILNPDQNGGFAVVDGFFGSATPPTAELCDGLDNDCDGLADEDFLWYADVDGDGVGDASTVQFSCTPIPNHVQVTGDCNDADPNLTVIGAACDDGDPNTTNDRVRTDCTCLGFVPGDCPPGETADCNGNCAPAEWVGDGFCDDGSFEHNGIAIFFNCGDFGNDGGDCGSPCDPEVCDGLDNDCDGEADEDFTWYLDADGDGFGASATAQVFCAPPSNRVQVGGDCDDADPTINPGATDTCDGTDRNCDGVIPGTTGNEVYSPDWTATATTGGTVNLFSLLAQGRTVVLDLFAAWCPPSQQMLTANFLQDWNAHMGPNGTDEIRIVAIAVDQSAGNLTPFINSAQWPVIVQDGESFGPLYAALGMYDNAVPTLLMICPDRSVTMLFPESDGLPFTGLFEYDPQAATALLNERCACRNACVANIGCMDVNACDYDPLATCPGPCAAAQEWFFDNDGDGHGTTSLGLSCTQPANSASISGDCNDNDPAVHTGFTLFVLTEDINDVGTAHYSIQQGSTLIEGDLDLPAETEGIGEQSVCIGDGCYSITITQNDVPLYFESYLVFTTAPDEQIPFSTADGYQSTGAAEVCDGIDNDCDGDTDEGFADADVDGVSDCVDECPLLAGLGPGQSCDDGDPDTANDEVNLACVCEGSPAVTCTTDLNLVFTTDGVTNIGWELRRQVTNILVASGGGAYPASPGYSVSTCLPDGDYYLVVTSDLGGIVQAGVQGGYQLITTGGNRIIDNRNNFLAGTTSQISSGSGFTIPLGTDRFIHTSCDKSDWRDNEYVVVNDNPDVTDAYGTNNANSGYEMWWYDPNGGYSFRRFQSHNTANGLPASATRACHFKVNNWTGDQLQPNVLYNVKVRSRVNGVNSNWGRACRFVLDPLRAQCPLTKLMDIPSSQYLSCGATRTVGTGTASLVHARPVTRLNNNNVPVNANRYQFRFRIPDEGFMLVKTSQTGRYWVNTNGLDPCKTYEVDVRASFDNGATWCTDFIAPALTDPWGDVCLLTTACTAAANRSITADPNGPVPVEMELSLYPNPNRGDQLYVTISGVRSDERTAVLEVRDALGRQMTSRMVHLSDGQASVVLDLSALADGMHAVSIIAGGRSKTSRLVIQK